MCLFPCRWAGWAFALWSASCTQPIWLRCWSRSQSCFAYARTCKQRKAGPLPRVRLSFMRRFVALWKNSKWMGCRSQCSTAETDAQRSRHLQPPRRLSSKSQCWCRMQLARQKWRRNSRPIRLHLLSLPFHPSLHPAPCISRTASPAPLALPSRRHHLLTSCTRIPTTSGWPPAVRQRRERPRPRSRSCSQTVETAEASHCRCRGAAAEEAYHFLQPSTSDHHA